ncbi:MAG: (2Fe-2S) ferredoxin domain-containing protein, partial [Alphaproteobacteria bacterium]|nr:(2Fe-2S) ferredoxin domain-containing protein [Alphaproteobacteria bacterium]
MVDMAEINKRFDIHEIAKNKLADIEKYDAHIYCCHSTGCKSSGSDDLITLINSILEEKGLKERVRVVATGCMGLCAQGPLIRVEIKGKKDILFKRVDLEATRQIMENYVIAGLDKDVTLDEELQKYVLSLDLP